MIHGTTDHGRQLYRNMALKTITHNRFYGGISPYKKISTVEGGIAQAQFMSGLNIHEDPSEAVSPHGVSEPFTALTGYGKWIVTGSPYDTNKYIITSDAKIYSLDTTDVTLSLLRTITDFDPTGQGLAVFDDYLYYATATTIGRYGKLSGTPAFNDDVFTDGTTNLDKSQAGSGQTYTTPLAITETAANYFSFTPTKNPIEKIEINIAGKGTGNWTMTLHDSLNNTVASATYTNGTLSTGVFEFTMSTGQAYIKEGNTYHVHITSTVADGTVTTGTTADLSTAYYKVYNGILFDTNDWHPMTSHLNFLAIGNKNYLAVWDQATYNPNRLVFAPGFRVRTLTTYREYIVAGCWKGSSVSDVTEGRNYYWDGVSSTFNFFEKIEAGMPNVVHNSKNRLFGIYGHRGAMYLGNDPYRKVQDIPKIADNKYVEVYPGAVTEWNGRTYYGAPGATDDTGLTVGIYEYGNANDTLPEVLNIPFTFTSDDGTHKITALKSFGKKLYFCRQYVEGVTTYYSLGYIDLTATTMTYAKYEQLILDGGGTHKTLQPIKLVVTLIPSTSMSAQLKYRKDRGSWVYSSVYSEPTRMEWSLSFLGRVNEFEYGFDISSATGTKARITGVFFSYEDFSEEVEEGGI